MAIELLDPTHEGQSQDFRYAERLSSLAGAVIAIVSNGKKGTAPFFDACAERLCNEYGVAKVVRITKDNYSTPVSAELLGDAERWHALVAGVGD